MLFNETLLYNLQYGDHTKSEDRVMEAATMAQIPPKLLYNMEMKVGERGSKLSGQGPTHCTGQGLFFFPIIYCRFLILHLISRFIGFASNRENMKLQMLNFYHNAK